MSDCLLTMEDLEKNFLDWVKIDSDVVNVSKVLNDLLDLMHPKDVTWIARDNNDNIITVTVPNIAKIIENIKVDAVSRSELTSILTNYYTKLDIDNDVKEGLINFIKQNYYDKTYIDQLYTTVRQVIDGLSEDTKDASRLSKGTLDPDRLPEVIHSNTTGDADTVDGLHGDQLVRADEDDYLYGSYTIAHDLTVLGNLNVKGEQNSQNTNELNVSDTWITLNEGESSDHVTNITSGIRIDRGTSNPARLYWDDDKDKWMVDYGENIGYELFSKGFMGSGSGLDADKLDGLDSSQFVRSDVDDVVNGIITFMQYLKTDKINNATGTQIVINAGKSDGKVTNQTKEAVYVNAEQGLIISTPDRDHSNWDSGYIVKVTEILGDSIKTENINLSNQLRISDDNQNVTINKDRINISQKDSNGNVYRYETLIDASNKSIISNWYKNGNLLTAKALVLNSDGTVNINNHLTIENSGITIKRTNVPDQYLTITEDKDVAAVPAIVSYSVANNAKFIVYDSKTNANNDAPTSGALGHYFRINGDDALIIRDNFSKFKHPLWIDSNNDNDNIILMKNNEIWLRANYSAQDTTTKDFLINIWDNGVAADMTLRDKDGNVKNNIKMTDDSTIFKNKILGSATTDSINNETGSMVISGGVGIAKNLNAGSKIGAGGGLIVEGDTSSSRLNVNRGIELHGGTSSGLIYTQEGNGRLGMKWNATYGTNEKFLVGKENAGRWQFDTSVPSSELFKIDYADGSNANAGDNITWKNILSLGKTTFSYLDNKVWHAGNVKAGDGISITDTIISHANTSDQSSVTNTNNTVIQSVDLDSFGHVTSIVSKTITDVDKVDGLDASQFVRSDVDDTVEGIITYNKYLKTDKINATTSDQIVINAGESDGKVNGKTTKSLYVNAEAGLKVVTPDSGHVNWASGYIPKLSELRGWRLNLNTNINSDGTLNDSKMVSLYADENTGVFKIHQNVSNSTILYGDTTGNLNVEKDLSVYGGGLKIVRENTGSQYIKISEDEDVAAVPAIVSYSATDNAKFIVYDSKTNANNDAPTSGALGHYFRINGDDALIIRDDKFTYKNNTIWHSGNDGSGSGLDADKLDGLDSTQFVRSDVDDVVNGIISFNKPVHSNVGTGSNILEWNDSGLLSKITDQGGLLVKADSSMVLSAGDQTDVSLLGINSSTDTENLHLIADDHIEFRTYTQNGIGKGDHLFKFNKDGSVELNNTNTYINKNDTYQIHTLNSGTPVDGRYINKYAGNNADTKPALLLFAKVYNGSDKLPKQGFEGRIYINRGGTNAYNISEFIDITCVGAYDHNVNYISGHNSVAKIVKTKYNDEDWYGIYLSGRNSYAIFLDGIIWGDYIFIDDASNYSIADYIYPTLGNAGYQKLDNGLILQWTWVAATITDNGDFKINLPIAFPHTAVHATGVIVTSSSYQGVFNLYLSELAAGYVTFHSDNSTSVSENLQIRCFAIGY